MTYNPQNFVNQVGPPVSAAWLNGVDELVNNVFESAVTLAAVQAILGIPGGGFSLPIPVNQGGTGASTANAALAALGGTTAAAALAAAETAINPYPVQTAAELAAGVTPVNFAYPPGYVDRYGNNTGSSFDSALNLFNPAIAQMKHGGLPVQYGATAPYYLLSPVNCTSSLTDRQYGFVIRGPGAEMANVAPGPSLIANHSGHVFDITGTPGPIFENVAIGVGTTSPQTAFFQARLQPAAGAGHHGPSCGISRFINCSTLGAFTKAAYYNFGAEDDALVNCYFNNSYSGAGGKVIIFTGNNILGLTSTFQTVSSGITESCIDHKIVGGEIYIQSHDAAADCISIEQSNSMKINQTWMYAGDATGGGRSLVHMDLTNGSSSHCVMDAITGEESTGLMQSYGLYIDNAPSTANTYIPELWNIKSSKLPAAVAQIATGGTNTTVDSFVIEGIAAGDASGASLISIPGTLRNSFLHFGTAIVSVVLGTSQRNTLIGSSENLTITTRSNDFWVDSGSLNKTISAATTTGITSSAGGLVARVRLLLSGNGMAFNVVLASSSGNLTISAGATITLTLAGGQSLAATDQCACTVIDVTAGTISGASVSSSAGSIVITIPTATAATPHSVVVSGNVFVA